MRRVIEFNNLKVTPKYQHLIQSWIYNTEGLNYLHDGGRKIGAKVFKGFVFSQIFGRGKKQENNNIFIENGHLYIDSFEPEITQLVAAKKQFLDTDIINTIEISEPTFPNGRQEFWTLSPVTVSFTKGGKRIYINPLDEPGLFENIVRKNTFSKAEAFGVNVPDTFFIRALKGREVIFNFKSTIIKGFVGTFLINTSPEIKSLIYKVGLGAKNSAGFGMISLV